MRTRRNNKLFFKNRNKFKIGLKGWIAVGANAKRDSVFNYMFALGGILNRETDKRIVKKIKKLTVKEAEVFFEKWRELYCERRKKLKYLRIDDIKECKQVIGFMYQEFRHLGIRIP